MESTAPVASDQTTVHVLHHGWAICHTRPERFPKDWPAGHVWVGLNEWRDANCIPCRAVAADALGVPEEEREAPDPA